MGDASWHLLPFGPSQSTGCWQHSFRLLKKCKRENIKPYARKILSLLNYGTLFFFQVPVFSGQNFFCRFYTSHLTPAHSTGSTRVPYVPRKWSFYDSVSLLEIWKTKVICGRNFYSSGYFTFFFLCFPIMYKKEHLNATVIVRFRK